MPLIPTDLATSPSATSTIDAFDTSSKGGPSYTTNRNAATTGGSVGVPWDPSPSVVQTRPDPSSDPWNVNDYISLPEIEVVSQEDQPDAIDSILAPGIIATRSATLG